MKRSEILRELRKEAWEHFKPYGYAIQREVGDFFDLRIALAESKESRNRITSRVKPNKSLRRVIRKISSKKRGKEEKE